MSYSVLQAYWVTEAAAETLQTLLQGQTWRWLYAERQETTELMWLATALTDRVPWTHWKHGRAFDEKSELAWWRLKNGHYTLRLLTHNSQLSGLDWGEPVLWEVADESQQTLLHGTPDEAGWSEARIPRWLHYPLANSADSAKRAILVTQSYRRNGMVALTRLLSVQGWSGGETAVMEVEDES